MQEIVGNGNDIELNALFDLEPMKLFECRIVRAYECG